jgi:CDP-glucose 4,6-dehydratase
MVNAALFGGVFAGRRVLVTGHTGFKGSWLIAWLLGLGAEVGGYALAPPTDPSLFEALGLRDRVAHVEADVRDAAALRAVVARFAPEIVFHLAAQPLVRLSYEQPHLTYETNVMGTVNLFEAVRATSSVKAVVNVTSDKCYENREEDHAYGETDPMGGFDPYSSSKGCAELVTAAYRRSFFAPEARVRLASARAGNAIGGGDWAADRIIPDCVRALSAAEPVIVRNPDAVRPWQHVLEPLAGYLWLGAKLWRDGAAYAGPWNFGPEPGGATTVCSVVEAFVREWGSGQWRAASASAAGGETAAAAPRHEAHLLQLDITKAREQLGWRPVWDVQRAVATTARWYREFYAAGASPAAAGGPASAAREALVRRSQTDIDEYVADARSLGIAWAAGER